MHGHMDAKRQNACPKTKHKNGATISFCKRTVKPTTGGNWKNGRSCVGPINQGTPPKKNIVQGR
jgi:hypothetical protein